MAEDLPPIEEFTETIAEVDSKKTPATKEVTDSTIEYLAQKAALPPTTNIDIKKLGYYLDGWADLIENKGSESDPVYTTTINILSERFSVVPVNRHTIKVNGVAYNENRDYISQKTWPGATTTIYVAPRGKDLYVSWRTYIKPVLNIKMLATIGIAALFLGLLARGNDGDATITIIAASLGILLGIALVALMGKLEKGNASYYFYEETTIFHAEDITAMNMATHKSILRALDKRGIDVKQLRLKQNFVGGRRDETI